MTKHGITLKQLKESVPSNEDFSDVEEASFLGGITFEEIEEARKIIEEFGE